MSKASTVVLPVLDTARAAAVRDDEGARPSLLERFLKEQADLTAVERFAQLHEA